MYTVANMRPRILPWNALRLDLDRETISAGETVVSATPAQFALLRLLITRRAIPLNRDFIMAAVFGPGHGRDPRQADLLVARLRHLLAPLGLGEAIGTVPGRGYMLMDDERGSGTSLDCPALAAA